MKLIKLSIALLVGLFAFSSMAEISVAGRGNCPKVVKNMKVTQVSITKLHGERAVEVTLRRASGNEYLQVHFTEEDMPLGMAMVDRIVPTNQDSYKNRVNFSCELSRTGPWVNLHVWKHK
jgi:hypothetical protein